MNALCQKIPRAHSLILFLFFYSTLAIILFFQSRISRVIWHVLTAFTKIKIQENIYYIFENAEK